MAPQKPISHSTLLSSYVLVGNIRVTKNKRKTRRVSESSLKRRDGLLNASVPARSELMQIAKRNSQASPLLRLPGEIRNKIWSYAVGYHQIDIGHRNHKRSWPIGPTLDVRPLHAATHFPRSFVRPTFALPQVCRQVYVEAAPFVYTLNTFGFDGFVAFDRWVKNRPLGQKRLVNSVNMPYDYMHLYRHGFRKSFCQKFPNIVRIGVDEHVPLFSRTSRYDTLDMAKKRTIEFIQEQEGAEVKVEWHYGVTGVLVYG